jgi:ABC-type phosphate transport system substrate-binding protein
MRYGGWVRAAVVTGLVVAGIGVAATPAAAAFARIEGDGSSWAANAVNQSIADLAAQGPQVVYTATGSAQGRADFRFETNDYAVTDTPYLGTDPVTGLADNPGTRSFAYVPLVAGPTTFPYHLVVNGALDHTLRLSGATLAKIFIGQITDWSDAAITADNNGHALPPLPIVPVVHSENSGASFQFTSYLASQFPTLWSNQPSPFFAATGAMVGQNGSAAVINYVVAHNGTIGYDEFSYVLNAGYPAAKVGNAAGYYVAPTANAVAIALTKAVVGPDLTAQLDGVYTNPDPRAYPLSSYAYLLLPTGQQDSRLTTAKRNALAAFVDHMVCTGQLAMAPLGYGLLPRNLVQSAFDQISRLRDADPAVDLTGMSIDTCNNPTFVAADPTRDLLGETTPFPPNCDRAGQGPCAFTAGLAELPVSADDETPPFAGALSLRVATGTSVTLTQVDPSTPGGHPAQATDPTAHRHAWVFTGELGGVTVSDTRPTEPGWTLTGQAADFAGPVPVPATDLGWTPALAGGDAEGPPSAGPLVAPLLQSGTGSGLGQPGAVLAIAPAGTGLGDQNVGASLTWWIPDTSPTGTYTSILTLTLISP